MVPFALENLLPAGSVLLELVGGHDEDEDWSTLRRAVVASETARDLELLVAHGFVRATGRGSGGRYVRVSVFLVPYDFAGVRGSRDPKILPSARRALRALLRKTDSAFLRAPDTRSLSEIFSELPDPAVDPAAFLAGASPETRAALGDALTWRAPPGMRLPLYPYQRRTVARMLQQELDPGLALDPLFLPILVPGRPTFYLQPATLELLHTPPLRAQAPGGILCEEMGTGKTCIVLALILATHHQLAAPEDPPWDAPPRPVLTPLALRHFPAPHFQRARRDAHVKTSPGPLPTLVETLTHYLATAPQWLGTPECYASLEQKPHLWEPLVRNRPFYHVYEHVPETASPRRHAAKWQAPRKMYLTSATLVVVPRAILAQWNAEINKHCEGGSLRVLVLDEKAPMPSAQVLASQYDMVLITHGRFAAEKRTRCDPSELYYWQNCTCDAPEGTRVPRCTCPVPDSVSPLIQIRWKRLVVDEGHGSATQSNLAVLAHELSVERRWIVSGTPTRNLMGLSLGQSHEGTDLGDEDSSASDDIHLAPNEATEDDSPEDADDLPRTRRWSKVDRDDLTRLGDMIAKFIGVPQFAYETDLFRKQVSAPLMDPGGPMFGAIQVLERVMGQVMFRHQIRTIEQELPDKLPLLKEKTVVLKFQPLAAKTYNVLQSTIAVNAVDSERKDQDYLFHPNNRSSLRELLENLTQTMFWRTDQKLFDIDAAVTRSESALQVALARGMPDSDIKLVEDAIRVQRDAAHDLLWRDVMLHEDNPFVVRGLSPALQTAWPKFATPHGASLLDPDRLAKLRHILVASPLVSETRLLQHGFDVAAQEAADAEKHARYVRALKRKRRLDEDTPANPTVRKENSRAGSVQKLQEINAALSAAIGGTAGGVDAVPAVSGALAGHSAFLALRIGNSLSSKVDYILRKVLKHAAREKFLVFSAFPLSLAYLAEALQVVQVPYLQYTSGVKPRVRQQTVVTFETSDKYRVLLMELKLGARGLNLVTASRIIFCEPIWQGDVESQAIKRAHRIGQKSEQIKVSTLVMQGTSEEAMVTRRQALKRKSDAKLPAVEEDVGMRRFLQNPTFIAAEDIALSALDTPGLDIPLVPQSGGGAAEDVHVDASVPLDGEPATKKLKTRVRFS